MTSAIALYERLGYRRTGATRELNDKSHTVEIEFLRAHIMFMEEHGYVVRDRVPDDRRVVLVRLSPTGRKLLDDIELLRTEVLRTVLDRLDSDQVAGLARATADLRDALAAVAGSPGATEHDHATNPWRT